MEHPDVRQPRVPRCERPAGEDRSLGDDQHGIDLCELGSQFGHARPRRSPIIIRIGRCPPTAVVVGGRDTCFAKDGGQGPGRPPRGERVDEVATTLQLDGHLDVGTGRTAQVTVVGYRRDRERVESDAGVERARQDLAVLGVPPPSAEPVVDPEQRGTAGFQQLPCARQACSRIAADPADRPAMKSRTSGLIWRTDETGSRSPRSLVRIRAVIRCDGGAGTPSGFQPPAGDHS